MHTSGCTTKECLFVLHYKPTVKGSAHRKQISLTEWTLQQYLSFYLPVHDSFVSKVSSAPWIPLRVSSAPWVPCPYALWCMLHGSLVFLWYVQLPYNVGGL